MFKQLGNLHFEYCFELDSLIEILIIKCKSGKIKYEKKRKNPTTRPKHEEMRNESFQQKNKFQHGVSHTNQNLFPSIMVSDPLRFRWPNRMKAFNSINRVKWIKEIVGFIIFRCESVAMHVVCSVPIFNNIQPKMKHHTRVTVFDVNYVIATDNTEREAAAFEHLNKKSVDLLQIIHFRKLIQFWFAFQFSLQLCWPYRILIRLEFGVLIKRFQQYDGSTCISVFHNGVTCNSIWVG